MVGVWCGGTTPIYPPLPLGGYTPLKYGGRFCLKNFWKNFA